jgi:hypothetical protein
VGTGQPGSLNAGVTPGLLSTRIRRLTGSEYDSSVQALLGTTATPSATFPLDVRQSNYTRNDAQIVDTVFATALQDAASSLAPDAGTAPCDDTCGKAFIETFATNAFRRPLTQDDRDGLLTVFQAGGTPLVVMAVLQSPSFLYLTELGATLTPYEVASELSYLFTGGPPDAALLADAASGALMTPAIRMGHARRLIQKAQVEQFVVDWLGLYRVVAQTKDETLYPNFDALAPQMLADARAYVDGKNNAELLGLLSQPAFLSAYSNISDSGPIHRGAAIIRQVLCYAIPSPSDVNIIVTPPPPDPTLTTRERFAAHANNPACMTCHTIIDPAGFAFEGFDTVGQPRTTDNGKPVDTTGELDMEDISGKFAGNVDFVAKLQASPDVQACFGMQVNRFALAHTDPHVEAAFAQVISALPAASRGNPVELLVALAGSDLFVQRTTP